MEFIAGQAMAWIVRCPLCHADDRTVAYYGIVGGSMLYLGEKETRLPKDCAMADDILEQVLPQTV